MSSRTQSSVVWLSFKQLALVISFPLLRWNYRWVPSIYMGAAVLDSGPHTFVANSFITEHSPNHMVYFWHSKLRNNSLSLSVCVYHWEKGFQICKIYKTHFPELDLGVPIGILVNLGVPLKCTNIFEYKSQCATVITTIHLLHFTLFYLFIYLLGNGRRASHMVGKKTMIELQL